jgi:hypothetical protein
VNPFQHTSIEQDAASYEETMQNLTDKGEILMKVSRSGSDDFGGGDDGAGVVDVAGRGGGQ